MGHKGHFRMYEFIGADGTTQKKRLCVRVHQEQIDALKATRVATSQPGQRQITGMTQAHAATPTATATVVTGDDETLPTPSTVTTADMDGVDEAGVTELDELEDDGFGFGLDSSLQGSAPMAQERFWQETVMPLLPTREKSQGTVGQWRLNAGMRHMPPFRWWQWRHEDAFDR
jgi:hypothetical protein